MKKPAVHFLIAFTLLLGVSCTPKRETSADRDPLEKSYQLIDKGEIDQAIANLEDLRRTDARPEVTEALASAYAARAGVRLENYWDFFRSFQAPAISMPNIQASALFGRVGGQLNQLQKQSNLEGVQSIAGLARLFAALQLWEDRIETLPVVRGSARADLDHAAELLKPLPKSGSHLYRGLLGLVILKSDVSAGFDGWSKIEEQLKLAAAHAPSDTHFLCQVNFAAFTQWSSKVFQRLGETIEDAATAFPSKRDELGKAFSESRRIELEFAKLGRGVCE